MEILKFISTQEKPSILLDSGNNIMEIYGNSLPENAAEFYEPVIQWFVEYSKSPNKETVINIRLDYINTSSSKSLFALFIKLEKLYAAGNNVLIKWYFAEDDEDMQEVGEEFGDIINIPFEHISFEDD